MKVSLREKSINSRLNAGRFKSQTEKAVLYSQWKNRVQFGTGSDKNIKVQRQPVQSSTVPGLPGNPVCRIDAYRCRKTLHWHRHWMEGCFEQPISLQRPIHCGDGAIDSPAW